MPLRYHQDLYYEEEDSDFETLGIPSDEETRHINEVPIEKGSKKRNSNSAGAMTHKPKIPPKPKLTPAMDLSQLNSNDETVRNKTQVIEKKERTTSMPTIRSSEKPTLPKQLSFQQRKMVAALKDTTIHTTPSEVHPVSLPTCNEQPLLLNNTSQSSSLSNLKYDSPTPNNTPDAVVKKNVELTSFVSVDAEDKSTSLESTKTNNNITHSGSPVKEDGDIFKSLSIDSGEHVEPLSDEEDEVMEDNHDEMVEVPDGDEETAKGKLKW